MYTNCILSLLIVLTLSNPAYAQFRPVETAIPVRDGNVLMADVYVSEHSKVKPVILVQTPYNKRLMRIVMLPQAKSSFPLDTARYHYVIVDWRGFYASSSAAVAGYDRGLDGYDIVEWIASQAWCDGQVATYGGSALGLIQFQTARHRPPHLVCAVPMIIDYRTEYSKYYYGGVLRREHVEALEQLGFFTVDLITSQPVENMFWRLIRDRNDYPEEIAIPLLMVSGWYDHYPDAVLRAFTDLKTHSHPAVRAQHRLIMGPWTHFAVDRAEQGELIFPDAVDVARDAVLRFFDYHLNGAKNGWPLTRSILYYTNSWSYIDDWDSLNTRRNQYFLTAEGGLQLFSPPPDSSAHELLLDPRAPSPSHGGARFSLFDTSIVGGPVDISTTVEQRPDVLLFDHRIVGPQLTLTGSVTARIYFRCNRPDTDINIRLCDVHPDGRSYILREGIHRARFRHGTDREVFLHPDSVHYMDITLPTLSHCFEVGHRLRLVVGGASYPRFDLNPHSGGPLYVPGDTLTALLTILYGGDYPSAVYLDERDPVSNTKPTPASSELNLSVPYPQPLRAGELHITFEAPAGEHVRVEIRDILGRRVRMLFSGPAGATHFLAWDGRSAAGAPVGTGTYLLSLQSASGLHTRVFSVIR
ncbi:MAG: CocE/NonD family hydrolase [Bacteroidetes bacterium]|nr:CocE/NonD family hydrolase [Bacteroidota bacterium]